MADNVGIWKLADVLQSLTQRDAPKTIVATVTEVDGDGTVWVQPLGSDESVPINGTQVADVGADETVTVAVDGGRLSLTGNASDPAARVSTVTSVANATQTAQSTADAAQSVADEAAAVAAATGQHFFADDDGVHVTEAEGDATTEHNILINSLGILLRKATNYLVSITSSAIAFYDGLGTAASNIVAQFGSSGAQIGKTSEAHMEIDADEMRMYADVNGTIKQVVGVSTDSNGLATIDLGELTTSGSVSTYGTVNGHAGGGTYKIEDGIATWEGDFGVKNGNISAGGNIRATGDVTARGNITAANIGTVVDDYISSYVSVATSTWKSIGSITLAAGTWMLDYTGQFANNANGRRIIVAHDTADDYSTWSQRHGGVSQTATDGGVTIMTGSSVRVLSSSTTIYLNLWQDSGSTLNCLGYISAVRIK